MRFTKDDIRFHDDGSSSAWGGGNPFPAINVKHYGGIFHDIKAAFPGLSDRAIERIGGYAWDSHVESFWHSVVPAVIDDVFPELADSEWGSAGRSGGWLVVTGLGDRDDVCEHWDAVQVARWGRFVRLIKAEVAYLTDPATLIDTIRANEWEKDEDEDEDEG